MAISIQTLTNNLSFKMSLIQTPLFPTTAAAKPPPPPLTVRMGGGPRTYPGGVSKWQWKRMQAKKAKQLLKARLSRERQIYEMRKRAELRAAASELERPWEAVPDDGGARSRATTLLSVSADDQLKALADRFQLPGGFDMWTPRDGPQIFRSAADDDDLPSARFFPKGVVHSVKPYRRETGIGTDDEVPDSNGGEFGDRRRSYETRFGGRLPSSAESSGVAKRPNQRSSYRRNERRSDSDNGSGNAENKESSNAENSGFNRSRNEMRNPSLYRRNERRYNRVNGYKESSDSRNSGFDRNRSETRSPSLYRRNETRYNTGNGSRNSGHKSESEVFDMSLQNDGSYGFL